MKLFHSAQSNYRLETCNYWIIVVVKETSFIFVSSKPVVSNLNLFVMVASKNRRCVFHPHCYILIFVSCWKEATKSPQMPTNARSTLKHHLTYRRPPDFLSSSITAAFSVCQSVIDSTFGGSVNKWQLKYKLRLSVRNILTHMFRVTCRSLVIPGANSLLVSL